MLDRARETDNIELVTPYVVESFEPGDDGSLNRAVLKNTEDGSTKEVPVTGAFVAIGHKPNSHLLEGQLELDEEGYVLVEGALPPGRSRRACSRRATSPTACTGRP